MLYSRVRCANVGYSYDLKFLAVIENLVDRKQSERFGAFAACGLVNVNVFLTNSSSEMNQTVYLVFIDQIFIGILQLKHI